MSSRLEKIEQRLTTIERHLGIYTISIVEKVRPEEEEGFWLHYCIKTGEWVYTGDELLCCIHCRIKKDDK